MAFTEREAPPAPPKQIEQPVAFPSAQTPQKRSQAGMKKSNSISMNMILNHDLSSKLGKQKHKKIIRSQSEESVPVEPRC